MAILTAQGGSFEASQINDALWWEFDAIVTAAAVAFTPDAVVNATISFVTTGSSTGSRRVLSRNVTCCRNPATRSSWSRIQTLIWYWRNWNKT
jgi:hypothetical protein